MSIDVYPQEEGAVFDANSYIIPCYPLGAITELSAVALGTTTAGRISVEAANAIGDGQGIALRAATGAGVPSRIPVLFYGVCKVSILATQTVTTGKMCMNNTTTTYTFGASMGIMTTAVATLATFNGSSYIMGMALQGGGGSAALRSDEILILVGKCI